jgi:hypothetical protein
MSILLHLQGETDGLWNYHTVEQAIKIIGYSLLTITLVIVEISAMNLLLVSTD